MIPCIGDVWCVSWEGKENLVLVLGQHEPPDGWEGHVIHYLVLNGKWKGTTDWHRLEEHNRWRWRKVTD